MNKNDSNAIISPFLAKALMSLLGEAAGEDTVTQRELATVWPEAKTTTLIREHYLAAFESLQSRNDNFDLNIGMKAYVDEHIQPLQRFRAIAKQFYNTDVERVNFSRTHESAEQINQWVRGITKNLIKEIVNEGSFEMHLNT